MSFARQQDATDAAQWRALESAATVLAFLTIAPHTGGRAAAATFVDVHGLAALPPALVPAWQQAGGGLCVMTASLQGATVGAMLFLVHGDRATYHIGWSSPKGKQVSAHNLILWRAIAKLRKAGVRELDLGGLNTQDVPGIARFKLGTGARVRTLCGTWFGH